MQSIDVFCVFPEAVDAMMRVGVVGKAIETGIIGYRSFSFRDFVDEGKRIDDSPYGGGAGMVIRPDVVERAFSETYGVPAGEVRRQRRVIITEPGGRSLDQGYAEEVSSGNDVTIVCGRYGGIDGRVRKHLCTEAVSLGEFVLSGGEIAAMAIADAAIRRLEGVLGNADSLVDESFSGDVDIGASVYTRPAEWRGEVVPGVLLSGDHAKIRAWRADAARRRPPHTETE